MLSSLYRVVRRLAAAATAVALVAASPAAAEPALWTIRDHDSTIYLFGTVHVLRPGTEWRSAKVAKAMADSRELTIEVLDADNVAAAQPLIARLGLDPQRPLSGKLPEPDRPRLAAAAKAMGLPEGALEPMRPWLAALTLAVTPMIQAGYDPKSGVETVLTAEAKAAGKPITALETLEQQLRFFADMPNDVEVDLLRATLDDVADGPAQLDRMVTAWAAGDLVNLEKEFVEETRRDYPHMYATVVVGRNEDWARQLKAKLEGSGVSFVAVGAGHLVGPDSVQAQLEKLGVRVTSQ
ncbi:TraB/GumN family protein [Phenylobacterium sp. J367]|uniref:TraB/GumN family protein n=1 Tax=Phenylobacterium sp. J367 TaxID=2898435 RepID=UPI002151C5DE|nr:TraB/GumN family protein [Phenylobacterium sp. J367]MCR5878700.1 TraB/GumN family protein [Phenylobacterium sp. J367]